MGGMWSGERLTRKAVVEDCLALDVAGLKRLGMLVPGVTDRTGSLYWPARSERHRPPSVMYCLTLGDRAGTMRLLYAERSTGADVAYPVGLAATPCHLGGVRWWFLCPLSVGGGPCGRRVRKLYFRGRYFGCRRCHGLTYLTSQQSDRRVYAALKRGIDLEAAARNVRGMSVADMGFLLKVIAVAQRRADRIARRAER